MSTHVVLLTHNQGTKQCVPYQDAPVMIILLPMCKVAESITHCNSTPINAVHSGNSCMLMPLHKKDAQQTRTSSVLC